jgi:hypothetical protein
MEPTVQYTRDDFLSTEVEVGLKNISYTINVYNTSLGHRWLDALRDNLRNKRILEKNFCFLGFASSSRNLVYLTNKLNQHISQINSFNFNPPYEKIHPFRADDFQYSGSLPIGKAVNGDIMSNPGKRLKHESCNLLHRYFEELQGTAWNISLYYKQANHETKYAIRQLNNLCHEIESWVLSDRKEAMEPEWIRPSQITTFLNAPRYDLHNEDFELFKKNRYDRDLGGVYLHWSQIGKTLYEVFRDEDGGKIDEAICSEINHQKYYSGEFDVEWGQTITESTQEFKKQEMNDFRNWLGRNGYDWNDARLSLGYIKLGQIDLAKTFGSKHNFMDIYNTLKDNLDIKSIKLGPHNPEGNHFTYNLENKEWKQIQMEALIPGFLHSSKKKD